MTAAGTGTLVYVAAVGSLSLYVLAAAARRYRALHRHRFVPLSPRELKHKLEAGEQPVILDLRHPLDVLAHPYIIPGARRIEPEELGQAADTIPAGADVVFYCTCPRKASTLHVLEALQARGLRSARPLEGGVAAWQQSGFPVEPLIFGDSSREAARNLAASRES